MSTGNILSIIFGSLGLVILVICSIKSFVTVQQGTLAVITTFGKFKRIMKPGLNFKIPILESVFTRVSLQNQTSNMQFQATTQDQANVHFSAMILYSVKDQSDDTVKNVAFKFIDNSNFVEAMAKTVESSIRAFVATKKQAEVLALRSEIKNKVKDELDEHLAGWGYHLLDLQINDITFDKLIMESMAKVVASSNMRAAAENEGQALLITETKKAEAEGAFIKIQAESERIAAKSRGEGVADYRKAVAEGLKEAKNMGGETMIMFSMWTECIKHVAENGNGNMIILDGSSEGMERTIRQMQAMSKNDKAEA